MTQFIEKNAVVAEIDKLLDDEYQCSSYDEATGFQHALGLIKSFITTLEVKDVDLEKEIDAELQKRWYGEYLDINKFHESAEYFFELGLIKAQKRK